MSKHFHLGRSKEGPPPPLQVKIRAQMLFFCSLAAVFAAMLLTATPYSGCH